MEKRTIFYIAAIIIVLAIAFLSQQAFIKGAFSNASPQKDTVNGVISKSADRAAAYLSKTSEWVASNVFQKIGGEVAEGGEAIKNGIETEKNKISENILEKTKNYFSGIANSIVNPGTCSTSQTSSGQ